MAAVTNRKYNLKTLLLLVVAVEAAMKTALEQAAAPATAIIFIAKE